MKYWRVCWIVLNSPQFPPSRDFWLAARLAMQVSSKVSKQLFFPTFPPFSIPHIIITTAPPSPSHTYHTSPPPYLTISSIWNPPPAKAATSALCVHRLSWLCLLNAPSSSQPPSCSLLHSQHGAKLSVALFLHCNHLVLKHWPLITPYDSTWPKINLRTL